MCKIVGYDGYRFKSITASSFAAKAVLAAATLCVCGPTRRLGPGEFRSSRASYPGIDVSLEPGGVLEPDFVGST